MDLKNIIKKINLNFYYNEKDNYYSFVFSENRNYPIHLRITDSGTNFSSWIDENNKISNKPVNVCIFFSNGNFPHVNTESEMVVKNNMGHIVGIKEQFEIHFLIIDLNKIYNEKLEDICEKIRNLEKNINDLKKNNRYFLIKPNQFLQIN